MPAHLFGLKPSAFVLWRPHNTQVTPKLVIGQFQPGNPPSLANRKEFELEQIPGHPDLWGIAATTCGLTDGQVYHYWFEVTDSSPFHTPPQRIECTDPTAFSVDWRLYSKRLPEPPYKNQDDRDPPAVVKFRNGSLVPCDPGGETAPPAPAIAAGKAASNNRLVIYELPTSWSRSGDVIETDVGTFRDLMALIDREAEGANFADMPALQPGRSHLGDLGVNALELLPITDTSVLRQWGYAPSNYFAPLASGNFERRLA